MAARDMAETVGTLLRPIGPDLHVHDPPLREDGNSLTMPFSRLPEVGDTWPDTIAEWKVVRVGAAQPGKPVDAWDEPVWE
jgi:hypothetical protein